MQLSLIASMHCRSPSYRPPFLPPLLRHNESRHDNQQHSIHHNRRIPRRTLSTFINASSPQEHLPLSAYIHLPFCKRKCFYCDFPVIAVGARQDVDTIQDAMTAYVDMLCREIEATPRLNNDDRPLQTIFFGGGTPSLISLKCLSQVLTLLDRRYGISTDAEISIEADPGTFTIDQLRSYRSLGITRASVGAQAFQDELLQTCGRAHDVCDIYKAIEAMHAADMPTWSLDLMSGLPGLTMDSWEYSLNAAMDASPHHISVYDLQLEEKTPFGKKYRPGVSPLPSDEETAAMYCAASHILRNQGGFEHYEVSNYAKLGHRCKHNMVYWEGGQYYAFGMGAASYMQGHRFSRPRQLKSYTEWVMSLEERKKESRGGQPIVPGSEGPIETEEDRLTDTIMLRLRLRDGLDLDQIAREFKNGRDIITAIMDCLKERIEMGHVATVLESSSGDDEKYSSNNGFGKRHGDKKRNIIRLSDPEGFLVSNDVISDIFVALDELKRE